MRDGSIFIGSLTDIKGGSYQVQDVLDEEVILKREDIEEMTGVNHGFNYKDYPAYTQR
jgi:hypothetical protein